MSHPLPPVQSDTGLWLELMADDELTADQRLVLVEHLDLHPGLWRDCAMKMMEHQSLIRGLRSASAAATAADSAAGCAHQPGTNQSASFQSAPLRRRPRTFVALLAYALVPCLALVVGVLVTRTVERQRSTRLLGSIIQENVSLASTFQKVNEAETLAEKNMRDVDLLGLYGDRPVMLEIENSARRAVYCTDLQLPGFVIDALLLAGNGIEVREYSPPVLTSSRAGNQRPYYLLEITPPVNPVF